MLHETPAKVLEQCIELFGGLRGKLLLREITSARWLLRVVTQILARSFFMTRPTKVLVVFLENTFFSCIIYGPSCFEIKKKTL